MNLRIIQTIAGTQAHHGGTSRSVPALCDALNHIGVDNHLLTFQPRDAAIECIYPNDRSRVHLIQESKFGRQIGIRNAVFEKLDALIQTESRISIIHDHAVWLPSNHCFAKYCIKRSVRRIVSPRGMLGEWALGHGKWKKKLAWALYQHADLKSATAFHATCQQEANEIRKLGLTQPIIVVPNGINFPEYLPEKNPPIGRRRALFLSRIHPKKGLLELIDAWKMAAIGDAWELVIAGPDEKGFQRTVQQKIEASGLSSSVSFTGLLDDQVKWQAYRNAELFVLPSFNENFGIVIAEAMAAELPVLTTTGTPWRSLQDKEMGWWVEPTAEALSRALRSATMEPVDSLARKGQRARSFVLDNFSWGRTAAELHDFYRYLLDLD